MIKQISCIVVIFLVWWQASAQDTTVFRSRTRAVQVSVVAVDQKGNPVLDLAPEDLILLDEGRQQTIQYFQTPRHRQSLLNSPPPEEETPAAAKPANMYTNENAKRGINHTVILLDMYNIPRHDQVAAMNQVEKLLEQLQEGEDVSLFVLGKELLAVDDLKSAANRKAALAANLRPLSTLDKDPDSMIDAMMAVASSGAEAFMVTGTRNSFLIEQDHYCKRRTEDTIRTVEEVTRRLAGLEGPKNMIWVTGGIPFMASNYFGGNAPAVPVSINVSSSWHTTMKSLSKNNITVYPVDTRGFGDYSRLQLQDSYHDTMRVIASTTGGKMFSNTNDITGAIRSAMDDSHNAYELAYLPDHGKWNGQFRQINLKCLRPGVTLRYRQGYLASREVELTGQELDRAMASAALSPASAPAIGFQVEKLGQEFIMENQSLTFRFEVDPRDIQFQPGPDSMEATVDVMFVPVDKKNKALGVVKQEAKVYMPLGKSMNEMDKRARFQQEYQLPLDTTTLKVVLRDRASGRLGSVEIPLQNAGPEELKRK